MAVLPPPPTNDWAAAITDVVEDLLSRMEAVERVTQNLVLQAEGHKSIRNMEASLLELNDAMLVTPARKKIKTVSKPVTESFYPQFNPYPEKPVSPLKDDPVRLD